MCIKCVRYNTRYGTKDLTYGQVKAIAQSSLNCGGRAIFNTREDNLAIEAHRFKILKAKTKRRYNRQKETFDG